MMASISSGDFSGNALRRFLRARRVTPISGPIVRPIAPPIADAAPTGMTRSSTNIPCTRAASIGRTICVTRR
jgi:hypothetical protein